MDKTEGKCEIVKRVYKHGYCRAILESFRKYRNHKDAHWDRIFVPYTCEKSIVVQNNNYCFLKQFYSIYRKDNLKMIEEEIETSGTDEAYSIKILVSTIFFVSEIMREEEIYLAQDPLLDKHLELNQILFDIIASGVDGTATFESK